MRGRQAIVAGSFVAWIAAAACSSTSLPPAAGDCVPTKGVKCGSGVVAGGSSGEAGATATCVTDAGGPCEECVASSCCSEFVTCQGNSACVSLLACAATCTSGSCIDQCKQTWIAGAAQYNAFIACETSRCTVCGQSGVGDPCGATYFPCEVGLTCTGGLCTKTCTGSSLCTGAWTNGWNIYGTKNLCVRINGGGNECAPSCSSNDSPCQYYPGTVCAQVITYENTTQTVCSETPDASDQ
jgi:hypothetical protein